MQWKFQVPNRARRTAVRRWRARKSEVWTWVPSRSPGRKIGSKVPRVRWWA